MPGLPQLSDLLSMPDQAATLQQEILPQLIVDRSRASEWSAGAYRSLTNAVAGMRAAARKAIATFTAATFENYVFGRAQLTNPFDGSVIDVTGWAPWVAKQRYGLTQLPATYTRRTLTITNASLSSYGPLQQGPSLIALFPSGNRYLLDQVLTIPAATDSTHPSTIQAAFRSEFASNSGAGFVYNDPPGSAIVLVTSSFPGVTLSNVAGTYSGVVQTGSGVGIVTPSGTPIGQHNVAIKIVQTGTIAGVTAGWQYAVDGGTWSATQTGSTGTNLGGTGINVTLSDNAGSPAFVAGTTYYFQTPGTDITQVGADIETPQQLGARCVGLVSTFGFPKDPSGNPIPISPTNDGYAMLALTANSNVKICIVVTDSNYNNMVRLYVAGQGGVQVPATVIANLAAYFASLNMVTDQLIVQPTTGRVITLAGPTLNYSGTSPSAAQAAMTKRLITYFGGLDVFAPLNVNGLVDYDYVISLMRDTPGVSHMSGTLTINGAAADLQLPVTQGAYESPQLPDGFDAKNVFTWLPA